VSIIMCVSIISIQGCSVGGGNACRASAACVCIHE
jgi:hypothetical protein